MQYMLLAMIDEAEWQSIPQKERAERIAAYPHYGEAVTKAGVFIGAARPQPSSGAATVRVVDGKRQVVDGPHSGTKEQLSGVYFLEVPDLEAALHWAERLPAASYGVVEVRPLMGRGLNTEGESLTK